MTWTYSGDPSQSALDTVRFLIGDTDSTEMLLQNEEILYVLTTVNNVANKAAIKCCDAILAKFAKDLDYQIGPEAVRTQNRRASYEALRKQLAAAASGPTSFSGVGTSLYPVHDTIFSIGMLSNSGTE